MNASAAYARGATGKGIVVAVIDSGVLSDHVELVGQIENASTDIIDSALPITDTDGHGTFVSGVIAGLKNDAGIHGIAFESTILAIRANDRSDDNPAVDDCGDEEDGCTFADRDLASAVDYAVANGAKIINLSLGGGKSNSAALNAALARAVQAGIVIIASAGNGFEDEDGDGQPDDPDALTPDAPANFAGTAAALGRALAVGATDQNNLIATFSNRAGSGNVRNFFLVAPGVSIITPGLDASDPASRDTLFRVSGTSFSAPYVAGAIALLLHAFPNLEPQEAVALLVDTAVDLGEPGVDDVFGAGLVDLAAAFAPNGATSTQFKGQAVKVDLSGMFSAPRGAFGDWAEKGGAFVGLVFQDKYRRNFTAGFDADVQAAARGAGLLENYADRRNSTYSSTSVHVEGFGRKGFATVSLNQKNVWRDQYLDSNLRGLVDQSRFESDLAVNMHFGAFHFGAGRGFSAPNSGSLASTLHLRGGTNSLVGNPNWFYGGYDISDNFTLGIVSNSGERGSLGAVNFERRMGRHAFVTEIGFLRENNRFFGANLLARFGEEDQAQSTYYALNWRGPVFGKWFGEGRYELAQGQLDAPDFITVHKQPISSAWAVGLHRPMFKNAAFNLSMSQPLRAESGLITFGVPVAFDSETDEITFADRTLQLTPSGREIDVKASFYLPLSYGFSVSAWGQYVHNPQHFANASDEQIGWLSLRGTW